MVIRATLSHIAARLPPLQRRTFTDSLTKDLADQYIHPLSQVVLEHLQTRASSVTKKGIVDNTLTVNKDGTFKLVVTNELKDECKIWTSFDDEEKKHWLTIHRSQLVAPTILTGRYMLQDNLKPAWHTDKRSVPERVQEAVDQMLRKLDE